MTRRNQEPAMIVTVFRSRLMPGLQGRVRRAGRPHAADRPHHPGLHLAQGLLGRRRRARHHRRVRARGGPARLADASRAHRGAEAGPAEVLRDVRHQGLQGRSTTTISSAKPKPPPGLDRQPVQGPFRRPRRACHGKIRQARRRRGAAADRQCRHRHDHPQAVPQDAQAHRARQGPVLGAALQGRRQRQPGLRAQQAGLQARPRSSSPTTTSAAAPRASTRPGR